MTTPRRPTRLDIQELEGTVAALKREKGQLEDTNATLRETQRRTLEAQKGLTGFRQRALHLAQELQENLVHERTVLLGMELDEQAEPDPTAVRDLAERMVLVGDAHHNPNGYHEAPAPPRIPVEVLVGRLLECLGFTCHDFVDEEEQRRRTRGW